MEVLHPRCCGLDVHKDTVVACVRLGIDGKTVKEVRTFSTTTADLMASRSGWTRTNARISPWNRPASTGSRCGTSWPMASSSVLANAAHIKGVPGRKSDVKDADWVSDLLAHGLIRASFVPDSPTQEMRTLMRTRKQLSREKARHILRIQKTLEDANIKLDSVISDLMGVSGRKMIEALIAGQRDPAKLARLADPRVKASQETLRQALRGRVTRQHRFLLRLHLDQIDGLDAAIAKIDREVEAAIAPFRTAVEQISSVPGVKKLAALQIISEIGTDMSRFPNDANLVSWACICPRSDESAGKRRSTRIRKGSPWLETALVQSAHSAVRMKGTYFQALFHRIRSRRGVKKAIVAVAASILTAIYHMLKDGTMFQDLGADHFDRRTKEQQKNRLVKRLAELGYAVEVAPLPT